MRPSFADTKCGRLRALMSDGAWHRPAELESVGGRRFPARLDEVSRGEDGGEPLAYDWRTVDGREGVVEYRLRPWREGEARPQPRRHARARVEELARENAELRARIEQLERRARRGQQGAQAAIDFGRTL